MMRCAKCKQDWQRTFKRCGHRMTGPRRAIIALLQNTNAHMSAEDIYVKIHKKHHHIGMMTVYRTLALLVRMKIVYKFDFGDKRARYEMVKEDTSGHHHHLVCTQCCKIIDYKDFIDEEGGLMKKIENKLAEKFKFDITDHIVQFYGVCPKCR